jgi:MFS family permease
MGPVHQAEGAPMTATERQSTEVEASPAQAAPPPRLNRNRDFNLLWSGQALSDFGTQMSTIAYPLLILAVTGSAAKAGIVGSAIIAGTLLFLLPAGVAADRWPRKRIMLITSLVELLVGATVVPAIVTHHIFLAHLAAVGFVQGGALAFYIGAARGALRRVVPVEQLPDAFARTQARDRAAVMIGPPVGATLFSIAPYLPFAADSISFGAITLGVSLMRGNLDPERSSIPPELANLRLSQRVMLGMRTAFANPFLRMVTIWAALINGVIAGIRLTSIVLAEHLGASAPQIGLLFSISAAIGLVGAIFAKRMIAFFGERRLVQLVSWTFPLCSVGMALTPTIWLIAVTGGLTGLFLMPINVVLLARAAQVVPDHLQAQVTNAMQLCWTSLMAVSPALFGWIIDQVGPRATILGGAGVYLVIAIWMLTRKGMSLLRTKNGPDAGQEAAPGPPQAEDTAQADEPPAGEPVHEGQAPA